jgi:hypothetical protein
MRDLAEKCISILNDGHFRITDDRERPRAPCPKAAIQQAVRRPRHTGYQASDIGG